MANIGKELQIWHVLKERLAKEFDLAEDDEALLGTVEGMSPLPDIIVGLIREAKRAEAFSDGLKDILSDNHARKQRFDDKSKKLRTLAAWTMNEIGLTKIEDADCTISYRPGRPSVVITDDDAVPDTLCTLTRTPNKTAIREALELGEIVPGAEWGNAQPGLTVRCK